MTFEEWMDDVDAVLVDVCRFLSRDLPYQSRRDWYDDGIGTDEAADLALSATGRPLKNGGTLMSASTLTTAREWYASDAAFMATAMAGDFGDAEQRVAYEVAYDAETGPDAGRVSDEVLANLVVARTREWKREIEEEDKEGAFW